MYWTWKNIEPILLELSLIFVNCRGRHDPMLCNCICFMLGWVSLLSRGWPINAQKLAHMERPIWESRVIKPTLCCCKEKCEIRTIRKKKELLPAARERERKSEFWNFLSSLDQLLRSTSICGPIELKFCRVVHDT
jgi:hypothetical protein